MNATYLAIAVIALIALLGLRADRVLSKRSQSKRHIKSYDDDTDV